MVGGVMELSAIDKERFWTKVDKNGPVHPALGTPCWLWTGSKKRKDGHGMLRINGEPYVASRVSWLIEHGS